MDKSKIKSFAFWAKENLKKHIENKLNLLQIEEVINESKDKVIEKVAYNWFYRFIALRFMEVNNYLNVNTKIFSSSMENNKEKLKLYKKIIIEECNKLSETMPESFEKVTNYEKILMPDNLLEEDSIIKKLTFYINKEDFKEVEIIGWLYQYYICDKREEIFQSLKNNIKISKENVSTATQIFTPKWIVSYMVENSLGRLWLENNPHEQLKAKWKYYIYDLQEKIHNRKIINPEDIKIIDPCMGSGNILIYVFNILYDIYISCGYSQREISRVILEKNIYGLDIDDRVTKLACFCIMMQGRKYNKNLFEETKEKPINLNLVCIQESNIISKEIKKYFCDSPYLTKCGQVDDKSQLKTSLDSLLKVFYDAKEYGSIIEVKELNFELLEQRVEEIRKDTEIDADKSNYREIILKQIPKYIKQGKIISKKYDVTITNPPYMGNKAINEELKSYIIKKFPNASSDLFSIFIERNFNYTKEEGYLGFMTPFVWMFISSYEKLREKIIKYKTITSLIQLQYSGFEDATVPVCAFTLKNCKVQEKGRFIRLCDFKGAENQPLKVLESIKDSKVYYRYAINSEDFLNIPGYPIAYWVSEKIRSVFCNEKIKDYVYSCTGMQTGNNDKFTRYWYEIDIYKSNIFNKNNKCKWNIYNEGGNLVKWYGNHLSVVDWEDDGDKIRKYKGSVIRNKKYYLNEGITWKRIGSSRIGLRYLPEGFIFDQSGDSMFPVDKNNLKYFLAYFNSKVAEEFFKVLSPTMNLTSGNINNFPIIFPENIKIKERIDNLVSQCIDIAKVNWDSSELSWDFKTHQLIIHKNNEKTIEKSFNNWSEFVENQFNSLKHNEEELNKIFIEIYGLQQELSPIIEEQHITMKKITRQEGIKSFISYIVGCMFGRYSIYADGVNYNNEVKNNNKLISYDIIVITDDLCIENNIVSLFIEFVEIIYGEETLEENLNFIAESLGKKTIETSIQTISRYFLKDFYKDHVKFYKSRPIYWLFNSGKSDGFNALIYIHKYNESVTENIRNYYLKVVLKKYNEKIEELKGNFHSLEYLSKERTVPKKVEKVTRQIEECKLYDEILSKKSISIDLDQGIKVNYNKFQGIKFKTKQGKEIMVNLLAKI